MACGPVGANGGIPVQNKEIVGVLVHEELEAGLVAVGGGAGLGVRPHVGKARFPADEGAAAVVAQHIEAAAGNQAHTMAVRPSEKEARAATRLSKPVMSSPAVSSRPNREAMALVFCRTLSTTPRSLSVAR